MQVKAVPSKKPIALAAKQATKQQKKVKKSPTSGNQTALAKKKKKQHLADSAKVMTEVDSQVEVDAKL